MFRQFMYNLAMNLRRFMAGRYGTDKLSLTMLVVSLVLSLAGGIVKIPPVNLLITAVSYVLMFWAIFRSLSRNTYKRYQENRKFLQFFDRLKDREHRYYDCPNCHQPVRVPRGKGKIAITCPRCRERFIRKT